MFWASSIPLSTNQVQPCLASVAGCAQGGICFAFLCKQLWNVPLLAYSIVWHKKSLSWPGAMNTGSELPPDSFRSHSHGCPIGHYCWGPLPSRQPPWSGCYQEGSTPITSRGFSLTQGDSLTQSSTGYTVSVSVGNNGTYWWHGH